MRKKDRSKVSVGNTTLQGQDSRRRGPKKEDMYNCANWFISQINLTDSNERCDINKFNF